MPNPMNQSKLEDETIVCRDGLFRADSNVITHLAGASERSRAVEAWGKPEIEADINSFIVRRPEGVALVDVGLGDAWGDQYGHSRRLLRNMGISPADVDHIFLTHVHHDHVLGLFDDEDAYFPNAEIFVAASEVEYLKNPKNASSYSRLLDAILRIYGEDKLRLIEEGRIFADIEAVSLPGHSPGHMGYIFQGAAGGVFFCGDVFHLADLQIPDPDIGLIYDHNPSAAASSRRKVLEMANSHGWAIAGGHTSGILRIGEPIAGSVKPPKKQG